MVRAGCWSRVVLRAGVYVSCAGLGCAADIDWNLDNRPCTRDGRCLPGYVCSSAHRCVRPEDIRSNGPGFAADGGEANPTTKSRVKAASAVAPRARGHAGMPAPKDSSERPPDQESADEIAGSSAPDSGNGGSAGARAGGAGARDAAPHDNASAGKSGASAGRSGASAGKGAPSAGQGGASAGKSGASAGSGGERGAPAQSGTSSAGSGAERAAPQPRTSSAGAAAPSQPRGAPSEPATPTCESGDDLCGSACVDLQRDAAHCGRCDESCDAPEHATASCNAGRCKLSCDGEFTRCGDACVDVRRDPENCNGCGLSCPSPGPSAASCDDGVCKLRCPSGQTACRGTCVESSSECGNSAGFETPAGPLCLFGARRCSDRCVWTDDDVEHCGECDHACKNSQSCTRGRCR
jgi:hypothetical protein